MFTLRFEKTSGGVTHERLEIVEPDENPNDVSGMLGILTRALIGWGFSADKVREILNSPEV